MIETADKIKRPLDYILKHGFLKIDHAIHTVLLERPVDPEDEDGDLQYGLAGAFVQKLTVSPSRIHFKP